MLLSSIAFLALAGTSFTVPQDGWSRYRIDVPDTYTLRRLMDSDLDLMECVPHLGTTDVIIGPGELSKLFSGGYTFSYVSPMEDPRDWGARHEGGPRARVDDYRLHYYNADQILAFFETLRAQNPSYVSRTAIGTSINGETMWAYKFTRSAQTTVRPLNSIVVEGLIHAREWITGACIMHIAKKVVDALNGTTLRPLGNQAVWIIPIVNPDGYRYTWTTDRYWRKNRRHNSDGTYGVDLNRNFSKGWGGSNGSSGTPGSEVYRGTAAFSEPESQAVRALSQSIDRLGGFVDYHSYAQLILWPWGYTTNLPPDATTFNTIGLDLKAKMSAFGAIYDQGETSRILYVASGTSNDYIYDARGTIAYGIELRDTGQYGFALPESQIYATQDEVWAGFNEFLTVLGP